MADFSELTKVLWQGGKFAYYWTPDGDEQTNPDGSTYRNKISLWFSADNPPHIPAAWAKNCNVYFGVHPTDSRGSQYSRSKIDDIAAVNCLFAEFDVPKNFENKAAALAHIRALDPAPSALVNSGGGFHCYWLLDQTYTISDAASRARIQNLQYAWVEMVGGDVVKDLARVLRVPGTQNRKPHFAPIFPAVQMVKCDLAHRITVEDAERLTAPLLAAMQAPKPAHVGSVSGGLPSDNEFWRVAFGGPYGHEVERLYRGDLSGHGNDHSAADYDLCRHLAYYAGDASEIDRLFRQSALYREKWDRDDYRDRTIQQALGAAGGRFDWYGWAMAQQGAAVAQAAVGVGTAYTNGNGNGHYTNGNGAQYANGNGHASAPLPSMFGSEYHDHVSMLNTLGYYFRQNEVTGAIETNDEVVAEGLGDEIYVRMRDKGYMNRTLIEAYYRTNARQNRYHPVKEYLESLTWNGDDWIGLLAGYFSDIHPSIVYPDGSKKTAFHAFLYRWLIGAVAKVYGAENGSAQNAMLVLDGAQDAGKSSFVRWLAGELPEMYIEAPIAPDNKDNLSQLIGKWIWEVGELGSTTRRADREALKHFLTQGEVTIRRPYERESITKPALASFIGTLNNETGFLTDITGNRRFMVVTLKSIDWDYATLNVGQVWAQAYALYRAGEPWRVTEEEASLRNALHQRYEIEDPYESWILKLYDLDATKLNDPDWFLTTADIAKEIQAAGVVGQTRAIQMGIATTLKKMEIFKDDSVRPRGYRGIKRKPAVFSIP
jgi:hypothetical protein